MTSLQRDYLCKDPTYLQISPHPEAQVRTSTYEFGSGRDTTQSTTKDNVTSILVKTGSGLPNVL